MVSITPLRLPIIDFSDENLNAGADRVIDDVRRALEEFGCFEAVYDKVTAELHEAILGLMEELFNLPPEVKSRNISIKPYYGHAPKRPQYPLYEGLGIDDATNFEAAQNFISLMWPNQEKSNYCEILQTYALRVAELEQRVKKMVFQSLDVEKYYNSHAETISYLLRLNKYEGPMTDEATIGVPPHTDKSFFTILHQYQVEGLEVETKDGEWIKLTPSPSSFIVMVGDAFYAWSNGRAYNPRHRVMMCGDKARYSTAQFSFSSDKVECPKELIDEQHPLLFKPFDQLDLLTFCFKEGMKVGFTLNAYFGV